MARLNKLEAQMTRVLERLDTLQCQRAPFNIDAYINNLTWSDCATDHERALVNGNLRTLASILTCAGAQGCD